MTSPPTQFIFDTFTIDTSTGVIEFRYATDTKIRFTEQWKIEGITPENPLIITPAIERILFHTHIAVGISYWKAYCPQDIVLNSRALTPIEAEFWNTVYTIGLGEFYYTNHIDFRAFNLFHVGIEALAPLSVATTQKTLVPLGGGKDSLVTVALLQQQHQQFDAFTLGNFAPIQAQINTLGLHQQMITRKIDPQIIELNKNGAYNGHVPISVLYAFGALLIATLNGYDTIALSNEKSANEGNVEYLGQMINHQWSKSEEFETLFRAFVHKSITPDITYTSILRPFSEIEIAEKFVEAYGKNETILSQFTSCNRNFRVHGTSQLWCGECPKCLFTFIMLAPFMDKQKLVRIYGKNMLDDAALIPLVDQLLGIAIVPKPFDCVGTAEEVRDAFNRIALLGAYEYDAILKHMQTRPL